MIKLIVGLGNPGPEYAKTRHNAGAWFVEEAVHAHHLTFRLEKRFHMRCAEQDALQGKIFFAVPTTYMNESGLAISSFAQFYQIHPEDILIAHDELDFSPGEVKLKMGGGHGGHNGLRDILAHLGSADFYRLRIGIGHPGHRDKVVGYVLHAPSSDDKIDIARSIDRALDVLPEILSGDLAKAMKDLHTPA